MIRRRLLLTSIMGGLALASVAQAQVITATPAPATVLNITKFGAACNVQSLEGDITMASGSAAVHLSTGNYDNSYVGQIAVVPLARTGLNINGGVAAHIASVEGPQDFTLGDGVTASVNVSTTGANTPITTFTDDTVAINAAIAVAQTAVGAGGLRKNSNYLITGPQSGQGCGISTFGGNGINAVNIRSTNSLGGWTNHIRFDLPLIECVGLARCIDHIGDFDTKWTAIRLHGNPAVEPAIGFQDGRTASNAEAEYLYDYGLDISGAFSKANRVSYGTEDQFHFGEKYYNADPAGYKLVEDGCNHLFPLFSSYATITLSTDACLSFNEAQHNGFNAGSTANNIIGGSGYNSGTTATFTAVPLTGGSGSGLTADITETLGVVTAVTLKAGGMTGAGGYLPGDVLSASNTNLGGSGSGFTYTLSAPGLWENNGKRHEFNTAFIGNLGAPWTVEIYNQSGTLVQGLLLDLHTETSPLCDIMFSGTTAAPVMTAFREQNNNEQALNSIFCHSGSVTTATLDGDSSVSIMKFNSGSPPTMWDSVGAFAMAGSISPPSNITLATSGLFPTTFQGRKTIGTTVWSNTILQYPSRVVTASGTVTVAFSDYLVQINKTVGANTAVSLPATPPTGMVVIIKDAKGDGSTHNITVTPAAGTIDGAATNVISTNYGKATYEYNGTQWNVVG